MKLTLLFVAGMLCHIGWHRWMVRSADIGWGMIEPFHRRYCERCGLEQFVMP